jgi:hypothetical protein
MTPKLAAHDDGDRTGGRIAMPIADEIAEAVLAGKAHVRCVGHVLAIGGGSAELGLAYRGNGQGVAIGIGVVRQYANGDRFAARGGGVVCQCVRRFVARIRRGYRKDRSPQGERADHRHRPMRGAPDRLAILAADLAAVARADRSCQPELALDRLAAERAGHSLRKQGQIGAVEAAADIRANFGRMP